MHILVSGIKTAAAMLLRVFLVAGSWTCLTGPQTSGVEMFEGAM